MHPAIACPDALHLPSAFTFDVDTAARRRCEINRIRLGINSDARRRRRLESASRKSAQCDAADYSRGDCAAIPCGRRRRHCGGKSGCNDERRSQFGAAQKTHEGSTRFHDRRLQIERRPKAAPCPLSKTIGLNDSLPRMVNDDILSGSDGLRSETFGCKKSRTLVAQSMAHAISRFSSVGRATDL
jgi:hypothetical protein